jgi:hypothetical protein
LKRSYFEKIDFEKIAALRRARGLLRKPVPARQERQIFGDLARQSFGHPSGTVHALLPGRESKLLQDAFLATGLHTVNPAPIRH